MNLDRTGPARITATGEHPKEGLWNCPVNFVVTYEFENPALTIVWSQRPEDKAGDFEFGAIYKGDKGQLTMLGGDGRVFPEQKVQDYVGPKGGSITLPKGQSANILHMQNFLDCIKSRETPLMDMETGHRVASICILANIAYRLERPVLWDPKKERIENDGNANLLLGCPGRGEFHL